jgi:hypothetical protein
MAKLVKSIYTGSDVTALGELTAADTIEGDITFAADVDVNGAATGTVTADNDGSFDMAVGNFFTCTPTGAIDLTFTNETAGQSGIILLVNTTPQVVTVSPDVWLSDADLTAINAAGTYLIGYFCPDGVNVYLSATPALTEGA